MLFGCCRVGTPALLALPRYHLAILVHWRSSQTSANPVGRFRNGTSTASSIRPSGNIHSPRTGRKLKTLATTRRIPIGRRTQRDEGFRSQTILWPTTRGNCSFNRSKWRSSLCWSLSLEPSAHTKRESSSDSLPGPSRDEGGLKTSPDLSTGCYDLSVLNASRTESFIPPTAFFIVPLVLSALPSACSFLITERFACGTLQVALDLLRRTLNPILVHSNLLSLQTNRWGGITFLCWELEIWEAVSGLYRKLTP